MNKIKAKLLVKYSTLVCMYIHECKNQGLKIDQNNSCFEKLYSVIRNIEISITLPNENS